MGKRRVESLQEQFRQQGYVEFGINPVKVALHLLFYIVMGVFFVLIGAGFGPAGAVIGGALALFILAGVGASFVPQAFGSGPALRYDRTGVSFRDRSGPVSVPWSDWISVRFESKNRFGWFGLVQLHLGGPTWDAHREKARSRLRDRIFRGGFDRIGIVTIFKILDASARDVVAVADADFLEEIGIEAEGQREAQDFAANPDDSRFRPNPHLDEMMALADRLVALDEQVRAEGRAPTQEESAEMDAINDRIDQISGRRPPGDTA